MLPKSLTPRLSQKEQHEADDALLLDAASGPLLEFHVNGALPGDMVRLPADGGDVTLEGNITCAMPLSKVVVYDRHGVFREIALDRRHQAAHFRETVRMTDSDWFALSAEGPPADIFDIAYLLAGTNAVRVYVGDRKIRDRDSALYFVRWIDELHDLTDAWPWWRSPEEKREVFAEYGEARRVYQRLAQEAR